MWNVGCHKRSQSHVEEQAYDRLLGASRTYNEPLTEEEVKKKILDVMKTNIIIRDDRGIDPETSWKKYYAWIDFPGSKYIKVRLCIIEDLENKVRKIKTLDTNYDRLSPNWKF